MFSVKKIPAIVANQELTEKISNESPELQVFQLKTQLLSKGRSDYTLAKTDLMSVRIKCYAQGGENVLHSHPGEDILL
ncbi:MULTISPECIES: hypothetical protein [Okeania]|uniref:hypothetical protein n=1 Tax=Okeania TaxID=1458928 RepID=UPI001961B932|nr:MULTISPECIES: hypothetical protein [Okeania]